MSAGMESGDRIADHEARARALDPTRSCLVQAPAGSGKTGLLIQRFLVLLAGVDAPEEIVAITFTRKAAGEMRQRLLQALAGARSDRPPENDFEQHSRHLAGHVLRRDHERGWQLLKNPSRLRIQTIDSLCAALAGQMPLLSRFGSIPVVTEDANPLYVAAARNTIAELESGSPWSEAVAHLVRHVDGRLDTLQNLLAAMLERRDQWLRHLADPDHPALERETLEAALARLVFSELEELAKQVPPACVPELIELGRFAAGQTAGHQAGHQKGSEGTPDTPPDTPPDSPITACGDLQGLLGREGLTREQWEGLAKLLLTENGTWRKKLTKREGFPAAGSARTPDEQTQFTAMKQRMAALLDSLQGEEAFRERLALVRTLPPTHYADNEWETIQALVNLLRVAAAHLEMVFNESGQVDFSAVAQAAIRALGEPESPTDLALALDYRLRHLLMDEFQDTSFSQLELLTRLTAGWQPGDGRTLFLVGDPMQSIYRFREAEVGVFLDARRRGIGQVPLESLRLTVNFRSQAGIVTWVNAHFPQILPPKDRSTDGAVSYAPFTAFYAPLPGEAVSIHPSFTKDDAAEARQVVSLVRQARAEHPKGKTAILVRSRTHLAAIVRELQKAELRFQAVDIEGLAHRPVVQDLLALTRALTHLGDRIAWLAVLRAPFCGLTLEDLSVLAGGDSPQTHSSQILIDSLHHESQIVQLSEDGRSRVARVRPILDAALAAQGRCSLRRAIEGVWIAMGGPACVPDETDLQDAEVYFQLLERLGRAGETPEVHELDKEVERLFALPDVTADESLQLMTIHRAKGLEFETVIIPGLGRSPRRDEEKLLYWLERSRGSGDSESGLSDLLLAPMSAQGEEKNPVAAYLQRLEAMKRQCEDGRLLYVAATRAKQRLNMLGHAGVQERDGTREVKDPPPSSLLARLWPVVKEDFEAHLARWEADSQSSEQTVNPVRERPGRIRVVGDWVPPAPPPSVHIADASRETVVDGLIEFEWAGETARHVGTVVHTLLQHLGTKGIDHIGAADVRRCEEMGRTMLARLGIPSDRLAEACEDVRTALQAAVQHERGRWVLSGRHDHARCELALSVKSHRGVDHVVIDRTFVDGEGIRWIIDYKTGAHTGGGVEEFLDREQERYRHQLERYAEVMSKLEDRPIRLGLYFPLLQGWREWPFAAP